MTSSRPTPRPSRRTIITGTASALRLAAVGGTAWALGRYLTEHTDVTPVSDYQGLSGTQTSDIATVTATSAGDGVIEGTIYTLSDQWITITPHSSGPGNLAKAWYVADVKLDDVTVLCNVFAKNSFGASIIKYPTTIARNAGALFAINGDYYGFRSTRITVRDDIVLRNELVRQGLTIMWDGTMTGYDKTGTSVSKLISDGAWQALSSGPTFVDGGAAIEGIDKLKIDINLSSHSIRGTQPKTGLGTIAANYFALVVVDGRSTGYSNGITMTNFVQPSVDLGAQAAYNLDGGGPIQMVSNGSPVNSPLSRSKEHGTSDILWIGK